jgi:hypothetical protein
MAASMTMLPPSPDHEAAVLRTFRRGEPIPADLLYAVAWSVTRGFVTFTPPFVGAGQFALLSPVGRLRLDELGLIVPNHARALRLLSPRCNVYGPRPPIAPLG